MLPTVILTENYIDFFYIEFPSTNLEKNSSPLQKEKQFTVTVNKSYEIGTKRKHSIRRKTDR